MGGGLLLTIGQNKERERESMPKLKSKPVCINCGSNDALFITLRNGERLPSYVMKIGQGIWCNGCNDKEREGKA